MLHLHRHRFPGQWVVEGLPLLLVPHPSGGWQLIPTSESEQCAVGGRTALCEWLRAHGLDLRFRAQRDLVGLLTQAHRTDPLPLVGSQQIRSVPLRRIDSGYYLSECGGVRVERSKLLGEKEWTVISQDDEHVRYAPTLRVASLEAAKLLSFQRVETALREEAAQRLAGEMRW